MKSALDVTPEFLNERGIRAVILDVDNTLAVYGKPEPAYGIREWVQMLRQAGISMVIVSNNTAKRVGPFASLLGLDYVCWSCKPLSHGIIRARRRMGAARNETAIVGDQMLTDIAGGNLQRIQTILVEPFEQETGRFFRWKRTWERKHIARYQSKGGAK